VLWSTTTVDTKI